MRITQRVDPSVECNGVPVLLAAVTVVVVGLAVNGVVLRRPGWVVPGGFVAGGVAAAASGYYQPSGNNGAVGVVTGTLLLGPVLAATRAGLFAEGNGDLAFLTVAVSLGWVLVLAIVMVPVGYLGALTVDYAQRAFDSPADA